MHYHKVSGAQFSETTGMSAGVVKRILDYYCRGLQKKRMKEGIQLA